MADATADRLKANMSLADTVVDVKSVTVELVMADPVDRETPLVLMLFPDVGAVVPVPIFHVCTVAVPVSTTILHPVMVPATGKTT